ncbi:hypothetical protein SAY86_001546 [Trapa natans]|uniref:Flap endonuclease 1 n=1 Tax=Trapa natans TaxID=22666 RepID=A0AAN7RP04_TRANT|nr:hypothetical protein SAY86_001546 [Trapa natans]
MVPLFSSLYDGNGPEEGLQSQMLFDSCLELQREECDLPSNNNTFGTMNFPNYSRPCDFLPGNAESSDNMDAAIDRIGMYLAEPEGKSLAELVSAGRNEDVVLEDTLKGSSHSRLLCGIEGSSANGQKSSGPVGGSSYTLLGNVEGRASDHQDMLKRKFKGHAEDVEEKLVRGKKQGTAGGGDTSTRKSQAAEVHNLSERRRRDRINEKIRTLQELIPNSSKVDKASVLEGAVEYAKKLKHQIQMLRMGSYMVPMMLPAGMQYMEHMPCFPSMVPLMPSMNPMASPMCSLHAQGLLPPFLCPSLVPSPNALVMKPSAGPDDAVGVLQPVQNQDPLPVVQSISRQNAQNTSLSRKTKQKSRSKADTYPPPAKPPCGGWSDQGRAGAEVRRLIPLLSFYLGEEMGIKGLTKLLADNAPKAMKEHKFESYFGRKIAIDASMSIYQFLIVVGRIGTETLTNEAGEVTSHLQGMFTRTIRLLEAGIKPIYIFDGQPPELKKQELAKRYSKRVDATEDLVEAREVGNKEDIEKFSKRTVKVTKKHNEECMRLLRLMGVPIIEAPSEAEAQCAALCRSGQVYAVASEDMDSLTFGAPRFLRHLMDPSSRKVPVMEFEISKILDELNLNMEQFIDLCILSGCDYCESIRGIGGQTALKLIRQYGSIENILDNINKERYQIPENWPYEEARELFKNPLVSAEEEYPEIKWGAPDEEVRKLCNI